MSKFPVYQAGQRLTATLLSQAVEDVTVKTTAEIRTSTSTFANDAELAGVTLGVGSWRVEFQIFGTGGAAAVPIKTQWAFTGTWNNPLRMIDGPLAANATAPAAGPLRRIDPITASADSVYGMTTAGGAYYRWTEYCKLVTVTVAGTIALKWAPNASNANSGGVMAGSSLTVRQIG